jgi:hypothetical protein
MQEASVGKPMGAEELRSANWAGEVKSCTAMCKICDCLLTAGSHMMKDILIMLKVIVF